MKTFDEKFIKNIVLVGAAKSGKTTLAETMMFEAGLINRRGTVEEKNTVSDYHEVEHERGNSVYSTCMHTEWRDYKINIIDTPGFDDFIGEVISSIRVCDTAVILLNAQNGTETGTEIIWEYIERYKKPALIAVNQLDHEYANFNKCVEDSKRLFGNAATLMQYPVHTGNGFNSIIDLLKMVMYRFPENGGKPEKLPIPDDEKEHAAKLHNELVEKAAENDEKLMEMYFEKGSLDEDELREGLKKGMMKQQIFPIFCLSAKRNMGSGRMMGFIDNVALSASEMPPETTQEGKDIPCVSSGPPVLFVFKTRIEPHLGKLSFFKVLSGEIAAGGELWNETTDTLERFTSLFIMDGKNRTPVDKLKTGDIGCTLKLKNTFTNHTLAPKGSGIVITPIEFPTPRYHVAIVTKNKADDEKLSGVLQEIHTEDPTLEVEYSRELKQVLLHGQGELHLAVTRWKLENLYKMQIEFAKPRISYRETILKPAVASYRHKKQSGGAGQFGEVFMRIEPVSHQKTTEYSIRSTETQQLPWGGVLEFNNCIVGGAIDARFLPSILKGVMEKMTEGPLTGSPVRDVRVYIFDGKMHPVDSNDISFKIAGMMSFKEAFHNAQPQLLEPINDIEVHVPEELMGDVMSDLQSRRSVIMGMDSERNYQVIKARTPLAELDGYSTTLRSITQGRAKFKTSFAEYAVVPPDVQKKLSEEYRKAEAEAVA
ncbi:MAG: elongation factor G [Bacteroidia bacterium]|nr:elongation factor G [Bacteroidia bacterium]